MIKNILYCLKMAALTLIGCYGIAFADVGHELDVQALVFVGFAMAAGGFGAIGWLIRKEDHG